jgi:hypothetical protein
MTPHYGTDNVLCRDVVHAGEEARWCARLVEANISGSFILHMHVPDAFWNISQVVDPISGANSPYWPAEPRASHER